VGYVRSNSRPATGAALFLNLLLFSISMRDGVAAMSLYVRGISRRATRCDSCREFAPRCGFHFFGIPDSAPLPRSPANAHSNVRDIFCPKYFPCNRDGIYEKFFRNLRIPTFCSAAAALLQNVLPSVSRSEFPAISWKFVFTYPCKTIFSTLNPPHSPYSASILD